ncbi:odorant receptor 43a-like [Solenopsis invicta]|uniref:odorant receptor 43a-like n=1 Tax=Solenopsis invicta TaxID=13686 RepID=UPI00193DC72B|nr:odorant receptor 43a-like [Solenopsis invicta]XP_039307777.1 odorant receptor 43a-like [Solenopsis invicta]
MESSKYNGYQDFEWEVKLNRFTLNVIGLWPWIAQNFRQRLMCNLRVLVALLAITCGVLIPSIHSLIRIYGDIMLMIDNLQFTLPAISCSIKIVIFWWKREALVPIMNMILEDWLKLKSVQEKNLMIRRARISRIIIIFSYCIMGTACVFVIILPIFGISMRTTTNITDPGKPLPLQTHYIYDVTKSPQYELTFISQSIYIIVAMMSYSGIDNFLGLLVFHICGQLDILKNRLTSFDKYINSHEILKSCITRHIHLLRAIDIIEDAYNVILLFLFVYFAMHFAFYGFMIISLFDEGNDISLSHLAYFVSTVINIFAHMCLYCAVGEILVAECNKIYYAAYSNKWYAMSPQVLRSILFLMIRGSKPVNLTAGKIFPLTMTTFCSLLKTSVGYVSVLHTVRS